MKSPVLCLLGAVLGALPVFAAAPSAESSLARDLAATPVHWHPWNAATVAAARAQALPVYLFAGSSLSELGRATIRQTFGNAETAAFLNQAFFCAFTDRDADPAVADAVQFYLRTVKQAPGWPAHVWLTPDGQPFDGANYLPPTEEWGKASFMKQAGLVRDAWATDAAACRARGAEALAALAHPFPAGAAAAVPVAGRLADAATAWRGVFDAAHGGFGDPPRPLEPELLRFLLGRPGADRDAALATLRAAAAGALRDPLDGGFFERASDAAWRLPYAQKTLAGQARAALVYLDAAQRAADPGLAAPALGALAFARDELGQADGTYALATDATGEEAGGYYAWTAAEIDTVLGAAAPAFRAAFGVKAEGNVSAEDDASGTFQGKNLLYRATPPGDAAAEQALRDAAARLLAVRRSRPALRRELRAPAGAHGLLLAALARAGSEQADRASAQAADRLFGALRQQFLLPDGRLRRLAGTDLAAGPADYAAVAYGCAEFGRVTHRREASDLGAALLARAAQDFFDAAAGRYANAPATLPAAVFAHAPVTSDTPAPEALAVLAAGGPPPAALVAGLLAVAADAPTPSGDVLLALAAATPGP